MPAELNPWLSMWIRPRATVRAIMESDPRRLNYLLVSVAGINIALNEFATFKLGNWLSVPVIFILAVFTGPLVMIPLWYLVAWLLKWTGGWIGGKARLVEIRAATAWSYVPYILLTLLWMPKILLFSPDIFTKETPVSPQDLAMMITFISFLVVELVIIVWYLVIYCKALGEVQGFSAWKGLGNSILASLVLLVPIFVMVAFVVEVVTKISG